MIDENQQQVGIVETGDALNMALEADLDLVEVSPTAKPPVCRIMDYGKYKYSQRKKEQKAKSHRHDVELKEVRIKTPKIGDHDLQIKINRAKDFLMRGDRVQFSLRFRGRELAHIDEGRAVLEKIKKELSDIAKVIQDYRFEGRRLSMSMVPLSNKPPQKDKDQGEKK